MNVTGKGELQEEKKTYPSPIRLLAGLLGYLLHPVFIIGWVTIYLLFRNEFVFTGMAREDKLLVFLRIFSTSVFLPVVTVLLLKGLGFIESIHLHTQKERIIPLVACITFFFWSFYVSKQLNDPLELRAFLLATFLCASAALLMNVTHKVSLHIQGAGIAVAFFILLLFHQSLADIPALTIVILVAGLGGSARLLQEKHTPFEIWSGFFSGMALQLLSWWILS